MRGSRIAGALAGATLVACVLHAGCGDPSYVLEGRFYVAERDCLGTAASIDVVSGEEPAKTCAPTCLLQRAYDGGRAVYVTTTCGPFAFDFDVSGTDPRCAPALAAFDRDDTCKPGVGSSNPAPAPTDAGGD